MNSMSLENNSSGHFSCQEYQHGDLTIFWSGKEKDKADEISGSHGHEYEDGCLLECRSSACGIYANVQTTKFHVSY